MLPYRHMDTDAELSRPEEARRDDAAAMSDDSPSLPRHVFTMTVEDVAGLLSHHGFERDQRTIQRWCRSGKLKAILDHEAGDRYLIEARSVDDVVATLVTERERQDRLPRQSRWHPMPPSTNIQTGSVIGGWPQARPRT